MEASPSSLMTPSWPERPACVPPQSSRAQSPTETTRTRSPYFSPNSAIAPDLTASAWLITSACTDRSSSTTSLTRASTSRITDAGTAPVAEKSKRKRPGAFSEPAWVAVSPSASRNALWTMWVAVWAREIERRRSVSTTAWAPTPQRDLAAEHPRLVDDQPGDRRLHVEHLDPGAVGELDDALVGQLTTALGVERRAVEHQLDLVALRRASLPCRPG